LTTQRKNAEKKAPSQPPPRGRRKEGDFIFHFSLLILLPLKGVRGSFTAPLSGKSSSAEE